LTPEPDRRRPNLWRLVALTVVAVLLPAAGVYGLSVFVASTVTPQMKALQVISDSVSVDPNVSSISQDGLAFSKDGRTLAVASGSVDLWDVATGKRDPDLVDSAPPKRGSPGVISVVFSPRGQALASGDFDGRVVVWNLATRRPSLVLPTQEHGPIDWLTFGVDGSVLAAGSDDGAVQVWSLTSAKLIATQSTTEAGLGNVVFRPDGHALAGSDGARTVLQHDMATAALVHPVLDCTIPTGERRVLAYNANGRLIASVNDGSVDVWDVHTGADIHHGSLSAASGFDSAVLSPGLKFAALSYESGQISVVDVASGDVIGQSEEPSINDGIAAMTFSPASSVTAAATRSGKISLWMFSE
jgi:WD40 repeat protein